MHTDPVQLIFENGRVFTGEGFGARADAASEVVFNTSMAGYQEILCDPTYEGQMVVMTYPLIGGYGLADDDYEGRMPRLGALIVREINDFPSNFRSTRTLGDVMQEYGVPGIAQVDTREITRMLRASGSLRALLTGAEMPIGEGLRRLREMPEAHDQVRRVSCKKPWYARTAKHRFSIAAVDCGIKQSLVRRLNAMGCNVTVVPHDTGADALLSLRPDGLVLSNGPGDPRDAKPVIALARALLGKLPLLGIGLGHQIIALACGAETYRMNAPHRGGNHPVREIATGRIVIAAQSHAFAVKATSLYGTPLTVTHTNLIDGTVEGMASEALRVLTAQYHPEGGPGPQDCDAVFGGFADLMENARRDCATQMEGGLPHA